MPVSRPDDAPGRSRAAAPRGRPARRAPALLCGAALCAAGLSAAGLGAGCSQPVVGIRLRFPSQQTFLITNTVTVDVYDGDGQGDKGPDAICRALSVETSVAPEGVQALKSSGNTSACQLLDGGVTFDDIDVGRRVFFAEAVDFQGTAIMRGCTVADVFGDKEQLKDDQKEAADKLGATSFVEVQLATLPTYPDDLTPTCDDVKAKCEENKPCVP